jgi:hypothetical protein
VHFETGGGSEIRDFEIGWKRDDIGSAETKASLKKQIQGPLYTKLDPSLPNFATERTRPGATPLIPHNLVAASEAGSYHLDIEADQKNPKR